MPKINKYQEILKEIENFDEIFMEPPIMEPPMLLLVKTVLFRD